LYATALISLAVVCYMLQGSQEQGGARKMAQTRLQKAIDEAGLGDRVTYPSHGETYNFEVPAERLQAA
jgi:hypothetical protein